MLVYSALKREFVDDVFNNVIDERVGAGFVRETGKKVNKAELVSWNQSLRFMKDVVNTPEIPDDAGVAIEFILPRSAKRIDFIITGLDETRKNTAVIVELKQWETAEKTNLDGIVATWLNRRNREVPHPSYQAWTYAAYLKDFNTNVQERNIIIQPCAYLHNYVDNGVITDAFYREYLQKAPAFLKHDARKLQDFVRRFVKFGDSRGTLFLLNEGRIKPSKELAEHISSMYSGNREFLMIDEQKLVFEKAKQLSLESRDNGNKNVLIVEGGPGTGKSVVAVNLLFDLIRKRLNTRYVSKNEAPRKVYEYKLTGKFSASRVRNLMGGTGSFTDIESDCFDVLIVDEAHRLNEKSGLYANKGENQIKEIIKAAKCSIFFLDEDQRVTFADIGEKDAIENWARQLGANVHHAQLLSQFRCNGSDGYLAWLDNILQIRETANTNLADVPYDFRVFDNPQTLHDVIREKNSVNNKARMVAGYCWKWVSKSDLQAWDIHIGSYKARWNLRDHGSTWLVRPDSVSEVGCIHTCQGLELDFVGVIIGPDLIVRDGRVVTDASKRAVDDRTVRGYKKMLRQNPEKAISLGEMVIKNTYRTLMTRGMKGCYVYSEDEETREWFAKRQIFETRW